MRKERLLGITSFIIVTVIALSVTFVLAEGQGGQPPLVDITSPIEGATINGTILVEGTASVADENQTLQWVEVKIDDGSWLTATGTTSWNYSWDTTLVPDGEHTIAARSYDGVNYSDVAQRTVTVDNVNVSLAVTLDGPLGQQNWYTGNVSVTITAVENASYLDYINYSINGGPWYTYDGVFNLTTDGIHVISYYAVDTSGAQGETDTRQVKIDATPPTIECHLDPETPGGRNGWYVGPVEITLDAADTPSGVNQTEYWDVSSGIWTDYTGLFQLSDEGNHTFMFRATDVAGHTTTGTRQIKIDHTAPAVQVLTPTVEYVKGTVIVTWNATDQVDGNLSGAINISLVQDDTVIPVASNLSNTGTYTWNTNPFTGGVYRLQVNATDDAGNTGSNTSREFTLDNTPPTIVFEQPKEGQILGGEGELDVVWNATDNIDENLDDTIWILYREAGEDTWSIINESWISDEFPLSNEGNILIDVSTWDNGQYQLRINATDDAGNTGWATSSNFTIDTTNPDVSLLTPEPDYLYINLLGREIIPPIPIGILPLPFNTVVVGQMTVEAVASDAVSDIERIEFYVNDVLRYTGTSTTWTWNEQSYGGTYTLKVIAYDTAGNQDEATLTDVVYINI